MAPKRDVWDGPEKAAEFIRTLVGGTPTPGATVRGQFVPIKFDPGMSSEGEFDPYNRTITLREPYSVTTTAQDSARHELTHAKQALIIEENLTKQLGRAPNRWEFHAAMKNHFDEARRASGGTTEQERYYQNPDEVEARRAGFAPQRLIPAHTPSHQPMMQSHYSNPNDSVETKMATTNGVAQNMYRNPYYNPNVPNRNPEVLQSILNQVKSAMSPKQKK